MKLSTSRGNTPVPDIHEQHSLAPGPSSVHRQAWHAILTYYFDPSTKHEGLLQDLPAASAICDILAYPNVVVCARENTSDTALPGPCSSHPGIISFAASGNGWTV